jgi:hypothetical protein
MLKTILISVAVIVIVFVVIVALQPSDFRVARSTTISAPPAAVFAQVNDFHKWEAWNPWGKIDPAMKQTYEGAPAGTGAIYTWAGNKEVGEGRMAIIESRPSDLTRVKLEFMKPFRATNMALFTIKPKGKQTVVTWSMTGQNNFMAKAVHCS